MDLLAPVTSIMTKDLITTNPGDSLTKVKALFDNNKIHHLPVVRYKEIVGIISKSDLLFFMRGLNHGKDTSVLDALLLDNHTAEDIMTKGLAKVESSDRINVVIEVFKENLFHALPVVDNNELVGIVTTYDLVVALSKEGEPSH